MEHLWRVRGELLFGGTGSTMPVGSQSDPTCGRLAVIFGNKRVSKRWQPSTITAPPLS